jgi:type II secretory pathway predicted ATPase ExeA
VDAYEKHFGFNEPPFSVTPDPRFFYVNPGYREAFATLRYGVEARKGFIVVTGEAGTGKTTLLRMLMQNAGPSIQTAFVFNPPHDSEELLRVILNELEVPAAENERLSMLARFNDYLLEQLRKRQIVALLIDEAQGLSRCMLEELRLLSNLETSKEKLIQIVLMGQPELEGKLDQTELRQLKQRVALRCRLEPLDVDEVSAYIDLRLRSAGYCGAALFDAAGIERIAHYSQGIPRSINVICENALLRAYKKSQTAVSAELVEQTANELRLSPRPAASERTASAGAAMSVGEAEKMPAGLAERDTPASAALRYDFDVREREDGVRRPRTAVALPIGVWVAAFAIALTGLMLYTGYNGSATLMPAAHQNRETAGSRLRPSHLSDRPPVPGGAVQESAVKLSPVQAPLPMPQAPVAGGSPEALRRSGANERGPSEIPRAATKGRTSTDPSPSHGSDVAVSDGRQTKVDAARTNSRRSPARTYTVVGASFVRETPRSDAEITSTLEPGTRVQVVGKAGDYFRVRGLDGETATGYVHQEDAFFEPSR